MRSKTPNGKLEGTHTQKVNAEVWKLRCVVFILLPRVRFTFAFMCINLASLLCVAGSGFFFFFVVHFRFFAEEGRSGFVLTLFSIMLVSLRVAFDWPKDGFSYFLGLGGLLVFCWRAVTRGRSRAKDRCGNKNDCETREEKKKTKQINTTARRKEREGKKGCMRGQARYGWPLFLCVYKCIYKEKRRWMTLLTWSDGGSVVRRKMRKGAVAWMKYDN